MATYEELKAELLEIASVLDQLPDQVQPQAYELLIATFLGKKPHSEPTTKSDSDSGSSSDQNKQRKPAPKNEPTKNVGSQRRVKKEAYSLDRDLDLRGNGSIPSFKEFVLEKKPNNTSTFNAVAVYYLRKVLGLETITLNHVYTCYGEVDRKPPQHFRQSFIDTKNKRGWLEFNDEGNLEVPHRGVVFVEHDLPPAEKSNKKS